MHCVTRPVVKSEAVEKSPAASQHFEVKEPKYTS